MSDVWKPVQGFPGYFVSDLGRIMKTLRGKVEILRGADNGYGYRRVFLRGESTRRALIHRLVAEHFLPAPKRGQNEVDHVSGNRTDDSAGNLRWASRRQNNRNVPAVGCWYLPKRKRWQVQVRIGHGLSSGPGRKKTIGYFETKAAAMAAHADARRKFHGEFFR